MTLPGAPMHVCHSYPATHTAVVLCVFGRATDSDFDDDGRVCTYNFGCRHSAVILKCDKTILLHDPHQPPITPKVKRTKNTTRQLHVTIAAPSVWYRDI